MKLPRRVPVRFLLLATCCSGVSCKDEAKQSNEQKSETTQREEDFKALEESFQKQFRAWFDGFASDKREVQEATLRSMWPTKEDIEYLLPNYAEKLWPLLAEAEKHYLENVDKMAREMTKGGPLKKIKVTDIRKSERASRDYARILSMIPKDVSVFECDSKHENGSSANSGDYLHHNGRWFWIKDIFVLPDAVDRLKD